MKNRKNKRKNVYYVALKYLPLQIISIVLLIASQYLNSLISLFLGQALGIFAGETEIFLPGFLAGFIDTTSTLTKLKTLSIVFVLVGVAMVVARFVRTMFRKLYNLSVESETSAMFFNHAIRLPKSYLTSHSTGDIIQRNIQDSKKFATCVGEAVFDVFYSITTLGVTLFNIFYLSKINFYVSLSIVMIVVGFEIVYSLLVIRKREEKLSAMWSEMDSVTQQSFSNIMMVKSHTGEDREYEKLRKMNNKTTIAQYEVDLLYAKYWSVMDILSAIYNVCMIIFVGYMFLKGSITFGITTSLIMFNEDILDTSSKIMERINKFVRNSVAGKRLNEYLKEDDDFVTNGSLTPEINGNIEFKNVSMKYDGAESYVLQDLNFSVNNGQKIGIFGKSGSGKSTLLNVLARLDEYEGSIKLDGIELKDIEKHHLRENIGYVNQDSFIFSTTIKENITQLVESDADYKTYAEKVCLDSDIKKFNSGYDTVIGERGVTLSGGQRQRISIARSLIKNKNILILDDCLSAVDNTVAKKISSTLKSSSKTTFIVSHNLMNFIDADLILVIDNGKIVDRGTHDQLINKKGIYKNIWALQQQLKEVQNEEK